VDNRLSLWKLGISRSALWISCPALPGGPKPGQAGTWAADGWALPPPGPSSPVARPCPRRCARGTDHRWDDVPPST